MPTVGSTLYVPTALRIEVRSTPNVNLDLSAMFLNASKKARHDDDFVFYNQPFHPSGSFQLSGSQDGPVASGFNCSLEQIEPDVHIIQLVLSSDDLLRPGATISFLDDEVNSQWHFIEIPQNSQGAAFLIGHFIRQPQGWSFEEVGEEIPEGLARIVIDSGINVDDDDAPEVSEEQAIKEFEDELAILEDAEVEDVNFREEVTSIDPSLLQDLDLQNFILGTRLADESSWSPARLFSVVGVGSGKEQERRATSALLSSISMVRPLARVLLSRFGAIKGHTECYAEVEFSVNSRKVIPDGLIRVSDGHQTWTALLEVKTGNAELGKEQVENYLTVARHKGYDAVITLSNQLAVSSEVHPVAVNRSKLANGQVGLFHISWAEVLHDAASVQELGVENEYQAMILSELIRYLSHQRSGAQSFNDMGEFWVAVRESVMSRKLAAHDKRALNVAYNWMKLLRFESLALTRTYKTCTWQIIDPVLQDTHARARQIVSQLASEGVLRGVFASDALPGEIDIIADVRAQEITTLLHLKSQEGIDRLQQLTSLIKNISHLNDPIQICVRTRAKAEFCKYLGAVRNNALGLTPMPGDVIEDITIKIVCPLGAKRIGTARAFIPSICDALDKMAQVAHLIAS